MDDLNKDFAPRRVRVRTEDNFVVDLPVREMSAEMTLRVKRLLPEAVLPQRGTAAAVGYDLASAERTLIPAGEWRRVQTGLAVAIPEGFYGRVAPRSGLAVRSGIDVFAGVIDPDYRGEIQVVLMNHGSNPFWVNPGDRIAQLILERVGLLSVLEVEDLENTARGVAGFGSTGR
jgi:dUTP pyrophosphatase